MSRDGSGDDPKFVDRYRIDGRIDQRWSEVLYAAFDVEMRQPIAVRVLFRMGLDNETFTQGVVELRNAARAVARLTHPSILQVLDVGERDSFAYLVTERLPGSSLKTRLERGERFEPARAVAIAAGLLGALEHVHGAGITHRNINPGCVVLGDGDAVKLSDFDLASFPGRVGSGMMSGKVALMAPEQIVGAGTDSRTDLFQVAVLLYRMLTGRAPFAAAGAWTLAKQVIQENPPAPSQIDASIPQGLDHVVRVALEKNRERRFASAREFSFFLRAALDPKPQQIAAHHILYAALDIGQAGPGGRPWTDDEYGELANLAVEVQGVLSRHGASRGKTVGEELFCCFDAGDGVVPALQACRDHLSHSAVAARLAVRFRALVHHGVVVLADGDAFGDNVGLACSMLTECRDAGIYFSAPAAAALPEEHRSALSPSGIVFDRFTRNAHVAHLVGSAQVYQLAGVASSSR